MRVTLEDICLSFEGAAGERVRALDDVSLELSGGVCGLMGQTGSGKTTLLEVIAGVVHPDSGRVHVGREVVARAGARGQSASIGLVFQIPERQFFEPTVEDEVTFGLLARGVSSTEARRRAEHALQTHVIQGYGLTEASSVVALTPGLDKSKPESVGTIISCVEAQIRSDAGEILPAGSEGQLWVRGASVAKSYYRSPELTEGRFDADGWFRTGDIGRFDEDGYLYLVGRTTEVIFVGGFKVYSREVESTLEEHPAVKEAAVIGVPRSISGEIVKAFVVLRNGDKVSSKELIDYCKQKLSYYKVPRIIEFISQMPRSAIGEIVKRKLSKD